MGLNIHSPRSIEACKMLGFSESDLLIKTKEDFMNDPVPKQFADHKDEYLDLKVTYYEKARQIRVRQCIEVTKQNSR